MPDNRNLVRNTKALIRKCEQLERDSAWRPQADAAYQAELREATDEYQQLAATVLKANQRSTVSEAAKTGLVGAYIVGKKLEKIRAQNYQRALGELRDIETRTKQQMRQLGV